MTQGRPVRPVLTSAANPRLRAAAALRDRRARIRTGLLLVDGAREVARALDGGVTLVEAFVAAEGSGEADVAAVAQRMAALGVPLVPVAAKLLGSGLVGTLPVGIVVNAGRRNRSFHRGTLADLATGSADFADGPAIILIGEAVAAGNWQDAAGIAERQFKVA